MAESAFSRYDQLLNAMGEANADKDARLAQIHSTKANIDSTAKILGETKLALSGMSAQKALGKKVIKPWLKKKFQEYKDKKSQSGGGDNEGGENERPPDVPEQNSNAEEGGQASEPSYEDDGNALTTDEVSDRIASAEAQEDEADEVTNIVNRGAARVSKFENRVANGDAEGEELTTEARQGGALALDNGIKDAPLTLEDWQATNATGFSQAKTSFTDSDLGETDTQGVDQVYNRINGLSSNETDTVNDYLNRTLTNQTPKGTPPSDAETAASRARRAGQGKGSVDPDEVDPLEPGGDEAALAAAAEKRVAVKTAEKTAEKTAAEEGGEEAGAEVGGEVAGAEAGLGVLDAIPGADIFGAIAGGILAIVEAHKQKKQEEAMQAPPAAPTVSLDVGVGGSEANV